MPSSLLRAVCLLLCPLLLAALLFGCESGGRAGSLELGATPRDGIQSYAGGLALWLVSVEGRGRVSLSVDAPSSVACEVRPATLTAPGVVEVVARPGAEAPVGTAGLSLRAVGAPVALSGARRADLDLPLEIVQYEGSLEAEARQRLGPFSEYLAAHHPEMGIGPLTPWEAWDPAPGILVVMWHSFVSADYEVLIQWHVMIPPHDWTHVYVRRRGAPGCVWAGQVTTEGAPVTEMPLPDIFPRFEAPLIPRD